MKFLRFIAVFICFLALSAINAQDYEAEWKKIDSLTAKRLPESALKETEALLEKIRKDVNNKNQIALFVKVLIHVNKFQIELEEEGLSKAIGRFQKETEIMKPGPAKAIMQSMLAEMYTQYLDNHIYKFEDRTAVADVKPEDISTWDIPMLTDKVFELYALSIKNPGIKELKLSDYKDLLSGSNYEETLQPTLFNLLINRAISFYANENSYLSKPAYRFYIEQPEALSSAEIFIKYRFTAKDSLSDKFRCLLMYQDLIAFHINDKDPRALVDANLRRLSWVRSQSIISNKDELYLKSLNEIAKKFESNNAAAEALYLVAAWHETEGNKYKPSPEQTYRWDFKKAKELSEAIVSKYPKSLGAKLAEALISRLVQKNIEIGLEAIVPINKVILGNLKYLNLSKAYLKLIQISEKELDEINRMYEKDKVLSYINKKTAFKSWSLDLPNEGDYQLHAADISIPACTSGIWLLMASENESFNYNKNGISYSILNVSDLAYSQRQIDGIYEFIVTDRSSGKPLKNVKTEFYINKYNSLLRKYEDRKVGESYSDERGMVNSKILSKNNHYSFYVKFSLDNDKLYIKNNFYNYGSRSEQTIKNNVHFFTDRAIYRPGQTIYFKGIAISSVGSKNPKIIPNYSTEIVFYDANYQEVARKNLTTNEFGSFEGTFTAPSSGLLGQMRITDKRSNSSHSFRVEEYKRPRFEVTFLPMKESFKLDDLVKVKGEAKAYAGSNIDGAKVQYRVVRKVEFPFWRWYWGWNPWGRDEQEIAFGETLTNEKGEYFIEFKAISDRSIPAAQKPEFSYTVYADVTDITGETHSTERNVKVGYVALKADISVSENVNRESAKEFSLSTNNLNGEFEAAKGTLKIEILETPRLIYSNRLLGESDYFVISEAEFRRDFPNMAYKNEDKYYNWKAQKIVLETKFDSEKDKAISLSAIEKWEQGKYKVTLNTQDKFGEIIEIVKFFTLYSDKVTAVPVNEAIFLASAGLKAEPGEKVIVDFGSFDKNAHILFEVEHEGKILRSEWIQPQNRQKIELLVEEKHRGGFHFHLTTVLNNRFYKKQGNIEIPWSNKELVIEYSTFRDKLMPGQEEEWKIKISGIKKDKLAAELLTGMYDASLDAFASNSWNLSLYRNNWASLGWQSRNFYAAGASLISGPGWNELKYVGGYNYASLNWFGFNFNDWGYYGRRYRTEEAFVLEDAVGSGMPAPAAEASPKMASRDFKTPGDEIPQINGESDKKDSENIAEEAPKTDFGDVQVRSNLNETVFFFPKMMTDENGDVIIKFTMNEALTRWKFLWLAHTKDLKVGSGTKEVVTQKDLMVMPNAPRFFRQNDEIYFAAKVSNMTEKSMKGQAVLQLFDAITMKPIDADFSNKAADVNFTAEAGQSAPLVWKLNIPDMWTNPVTYRVIAKSGAFSDAEENSLPVVSNRMLVTETMPLPIRGGQSKTFEFKRMSELSKSNTMRHHKYTLEFTPNPAWYAVQALPYIMEYPYECTEQVFSRFYANSIAASVANSHPKIKKVFESWRDFQPEALKSNLSKNQELKYALLEETPWVMAAQSEEQQKKDLGVLFDLNRMANELEKARDKMADRQLSNGGFAWFPGGRDNWYITQYIVEGIGHLDVLGVKSIKSDYQFAEMVVKAVNYTDDRLADHYETLLKEAKKSKEGEKAFLEKDNLDYMSIHYLYARSFYRDIPVINEKTLKAINYYEAQAAKYWLSKNDYMQGMLALALHRKETDKTTPQNIVKSLKERALKNEEMGMYWKYPSGYFWYEMPIETHCLLIEVFDVVANDAQAVDDLKTYLLKAKQTTHWKTTKATASACYALLSTGDNWLMEDQELKISIGNQLLDQSKINKEAGTGYFKTSWEGPQIKNEMDTIKVENPNKNVAWGAIYWQYFEQLDKITDFKETPLKIIKKLFKEVRTDRGPVLQPITTQSKLMPGDLIKVRIELKVDRDMEYIHMKDMRASGFEPVNVLSQYKYQGGLGYYESTRDVSINFFIDYLSKGNYVFEYGLRVNHKGDFSNGVTTIQCMYAPEFTSHSEGVRVKVE